MTQLVEFEDGPPQRYRDEMLDAGATAPVYLSEDGRFVLKIFPPAIPPTAESRASEQRHHAALREVVNRYQFISRHPYWSELFAWPDRVAIRMGVRPCLGVRMPFVHLPSLEKPIEYLDLRQGNLYHHLVNPEERGWWIGRVAIAIKVARAMAYLESHALAHTDISAKNVRGNPFTGEMVLIDCDGIVSPGTPLFAQVVGTPGYQAPELISGAVATPTRYTDRHALAVLIHQLLLYRHPLLGPRRPPHPETMTAEQEEQWLFGEGAHYIEDPRDHYANLPDGKVISTATLGGRIKGLFDKAFITGLHQPGERPLAHEWEDALTRLYDRILPCTNPRCFQRFFSAPEDPGPLACSMCGHVLDGPQSLPYLRLQRFREGTDTEPAHYEDDNGHVVVGWLGRLLHAWHLSTDVTPVPADGHPYDPRPVGRFLYDGGMGDIDEDDGDKDIWYLRNERMAELLVVGASQNVPIGADVPLSDGLQMWLGSTTRSRLVTAQMVPALENEVIYCLPDSDTRPARPWPTLTPRLRDMAWRPGDPLTLAKDSGYVTQARRDFNGAGLNPQPGSLRAVKSAVLAVLRAIRATALIALLVVVGSAAATGGPATLVSWAAPDHRLIVLVALGIGLVGTVLGGLRFGAWFLVLMLLALTVQSAPSIIEQPLPATLGALAGGLLGLLIVRRAQQAAKPD
jgi:hypothetical protein